jgi:ABC-type antimicrobial peptide transport system permease subunit
VILYGIRYTVVGVVGDVRNFSLASDARPTMYFSSSQFISSQMALVIRTKGDVPVAATVRKAVSAIDPQLAVFNVRSMEALMEANTTQPRVTAWLVGMFAMLALLLAAIGVYGVLAYLVTQRRREIGVRIALGAQPGSVLGLVVAHSLRLSVAGVVIGAAAAFLLAPQIQTQLYQVQPRDPATLIAVSLSLLAISVLASYIPARRATRVDPLTALRAE